MILPGTFCSCTVINWIALSILKDCGGTKHFFCFDFRYFSPKYYARAVGNFYLQ